MSSRQDDSGTGGTDQQVIRIERLRSAQRIALESLKEDHRALEIDAKRAFGPAAAMAGRSAPDPSA